MWSMTVWPFLNCLRLGVLERNICPGFVFAGDLLLSTRPHEQPPFGRICFGYVSAGIFSSKSQVFWTLLHWVIFPNNIHGICSINSKARDDVFGLQTFNVQWSKGLRSLYSMILVHNFIVPLLGKLQEVNPFFLRTCVLHRNYYNSKSVVYCPSFWWEINYFPELKTCLSTEFAVCLDLLVWCLEQVPNIFSQMVVVHGFMVICHGTIRQKKNTKKKQGQEVGLLTIGFPLIRPY